MKEETEEEAFADADKLLDLSGADRRTRERARVRLARDPVKRAELRRLFGIAEKGAQKLRKFAEKAPE